MSRLRAILRPHAPPRSLALGVLGTLAGAVLPASADAQIVMGRVVAGSGRVLSGVLVSLESAPRDSTRGETTSAPAPVWRDSARTSADGIFSIRAPIPGTYRLRIGVALTGPSMTLASVDTVDERQYVVPDMADATGDATSDETSDGAAAVRARGSAYEPPRMLASSPPDLDVTGPTVSGRDAVRVEIDVLVNADGTPDMRTFRLTGRASAENRTALERWIAAAQFAPARRGGVPVGAVYHVELGVRVEVRRM